MSQLDMDFEIINSNFTDVSASVDGGVFFTDKLKSLSILSTLFTSFNATSRGSLVYSTSTSI